MSDNPIHPKLSKEAEEEAQAWINYFKEKMKNICDEVLSEAYCDVIHYIESDSWGNFRNDVIAGFQDYPNGKIKSKYDFKKLRQAILKNHREEIIADLNQDLLEENEKLKKRNSALHDDIRRANRY